VESTLRRRLMEGAADAPRIGEVHPARDGLFPPYVVLDGTAEPVEPVTLYLRDLALSDMSRLTCRSYAFDLLRWFRFLWSLEVPWDRASSGEVAVMVGWMRTACNPQRATRSGESRGAVNARTGKSLLGPGYAPRTINHTLSVVSRLYEFHARYGNGPVINPVPAVADRRRVLAHCSPLEPTPMLRRARLRQRVPAAAPKAIPDSLWDELFRVMSATGTAR
jgi:hypothetical protein